MPKNSLTSENLEKLPVPNGSIEVNYQCTAIVQQRLQEVTS
ncbi:hypothetical protein [Microcoleus sp. S36b_A4]